jgi:hypothetical protein
VARELAWRHPCPPSLTLCPTFSLSFLISQDFPYNFEAGVEHHNVWASRPLADAELAAAVASHRPPAAWEAVWFVNPASLASIPTVWHAHVLSRRVEGEGAGGGGGGGEGVTV